MLKPIPNIQNDRLIRKLSECGISSYPSSTYLLESRPPNAVVREKEIKLFGGY